MLRSKLPIHFKHIAWFVVSILVLVDVALEAYLLDMLPYMSMVSILVLVDVALEVGRAGGVIIMPGSFNPCSRGCCARRGMEDRAGRVRYQFQSLFSWMLRSKRNEKLIVLQTALFQSLFSWMLRSKLGLYPDRVQLQGFNPCSRGCCARSRLRVWKTAGTQVSILVLVDVALEADDADGDPAGLLVSILVLVDVALEGREISRFLSLIAIKWLKFSGSNSSSGIMDSYLNIRIRCRLSSNNSQCTYSCISLCSDKILYR